MSAAHDWRTVYDFWFPPGLDATAEIHRQTFGWWFGGGSNAELARFAPLLTEARAGRLNAWLAAPLGRLALIIVLDQFPRGLLAGTPSAYASDGAALVAAEEGLRNGHFQALAAPWEKTFFLLPLAHAEGPNHLARLDRVAALAEGILAETPPPLQALYRHSADQARRHAEVIARYGRYPHRNDVLGRASTPEELAYIAKGDLVHQRPLPPS